MSSQSSISLKRAPILFGIASLGISSVITQITLTRELLNLFLGNELVVGLIISIWLILTGLGAFLGKYRKHHVPVLILSLVCVAFLPFLHLLALRYFRGIVAVPGAALDIRVLLVYLPFLVAPYCLVSGYLLTLACAMLGREGDPLSLGTVYFVDNIGDILGGLLFSFVIIHFLSTFNALFVPAVLSLLAATWLSRQYGYKRCCLGILTLLSPLLVMLLVDMDGRSAGWLYPGQEIVDRKESPYGRIVVTRDAEQYNFFENGVPFYSTGDVLDAEESVHFCMAQLPQRDLRVLLLSGGVIGVSAEVLKYPVVKIDYVELDPAVVSAGRRFGTATEDTRVTVHLEDGRRFMQESTETYDAVIIGLPPPSNIQVNRFYTVEFFRLLKEHLSPGGMVSFSMPGAENYYPGELADLYSVAATTVRQVFGNVTAFPVGKTVFVASDAPVSHGVGQLLADKGIRTRYVNAFYLDGMLTPDRLDQVEKCLVESSMVNRDLRPVAFGLQLRHRLSRSGVDIRWILWVAAIVGVLFVFLYGPAETALWTTGFSAISTEIVVLLLLQVHSGYVYRAYGLMITLFMAGLAAGSLAANRFLARSGAGGKELLLRVDLLVVAFAMVIAAGVGWTGLWRNDLVLYFLVGIAAFLTGAEFPSAGSFMPVNMESAAGRLYAADFLGAGIGSLLCSVLLIPALGVRNTLLALVALKILSVVKLLRCA